MMPLGVAAEDHFSLTRLPYPRVCKRLLPSSLPMQQEAHQTEDTDLREYIAVVRKQKWFIAIVAGVVVMLSLGLTARSTPVYTSVARVLVLPTAPANSPFYFLATINMDTESG